MKTLEEKVDHLMVEIATVKGRLNGIIVVAGLAATLYAAKGC